MTKRIVLIRPCCIGDVVMATGALSALRHAYPDAHITWAVGGWSRHAVEYHPAINAIMDTGMQALPDKSIGGFFRFVRQLRSGNFDIAISLVRSPLMSLAVLLSGIPTRVGIDSNGRGFGYTHKHAIDPTQPIHEAQLYLNVVRELGIDVTGYQVNLPVQEKTSQSVHSKLKQNNIAQSYLVINPAGGNNPGMLMDSKRYPPISFAQIADTLAQENNWQVVILAGPDDSSLVDALKSYLETPSTSFIGTLTFPEIGALAQQSALYIGNDTGLTHLAAASGAKTAMLLGPSDPVRYAPFTDNSLALWQPTTVSRVGVAQVDTSHWDWSRDGIIPEDALVKLRQFIAL